MITRIPNWVKVYNTMSIEKMMLKEIFNRSYIKCRNPRHANMVDKIPRLV